MILPVFSWRNDLGLLVGRHREVGGVTRDNKVGQAIMGQFQNHIVVFVRNKVEFDGWRVFSGVGFNIDQQALGAGKKIGKPGKFRAGQYVVVLGHQLAGDTELNFFVNKKVVNNSVRIAFLDQSRNDHVRNNDDLLHLV